MKKIVVAIVLLCTVQMVHAQMRATTRKTTKSIKVDKKKIEEEIKMKVLAFHKAVFIDKDSAALENLLAKEVTYGHSGGKLENRAEVIDHCGHNPSTYSGIEAGEITIIVNGGTVVTRYVLTGTENKPDGKAVELHLNILQTWIKEGGDWKMMARQATKLNK